MEKKSSALKLYSDVQTSTVEWLWYPYIPYGKITLLQGDPGEGKSTMMMDLIARISRGGVVPNGKENFLAQRVIYQCSEDSAADTIKPRLEASGANCKNIAFLDESLITLTLNDDRLREAICDFKAKVVVIDPFQAYVNTEGDISSAVRSRKIMQKLGSWAATYRCAIVLIGHLNKSGAGNELYRCLGSIDVAATARSVMQVFRDKDNPDVKILHHVKSNLAKLAEDSTFEVNSDRTIRWISCSGGAVDHTSIMSLVDEYNLSSEKQEIIAKLVVEQLKTGPVKANLMKEILSQCDVSMKTINKTKSLLGVQSIRRDGQWYWVLPEDAEK